MVLLLMILAFIIAVLFWVGEKRASAIIAIMLMCFVRPFYDGQELLLIISILNSVGAFVVAILLCQLVIREHE